RQPHLHHAAVAAGGEGAAVGRVGDGADAAADVSVEPVLAGAVESIKIAPFPAAEVLGGLPKEFPGAVGVVRLPLAVDEADGGGVGVAPRVVRALLGHLLVELCLLRQAFGRLALPLRVDPRLIRGGGAAVGLLLFCLRLLRLLTGFLRLRVPLRRELDRVEPLPDDAADAAEQRDEQGRPERREDRLAAATAPAPRRAG